MRRLHLLMNALQEVAHFRLHRGESRLHPAFSRAPLAEVEEPDSIPLDLRKLNYSVRFLANIANHVIAPAFVYVVRYHGATRPAASDHNLPDYRLAELAALEQQHPAGPRGKTSVVRNDNHSNLEVVDDLH